MSSNQEPFFTLELDSVETAWLLNLLAQSEKAMEQNVKVIAGMSSSDPRSKHRATLLQAASIDQALATQFRERLEMSGIGDAESALREATDN